MNDEDQNQNQNEPDTDTDVQEDQGDDVDWKTKYEEMKKHSRTWEQRAKDNLEELEKYRQGDKSESEKIRDRLTQVEQDYSELRSENLRLSIGAEFGLSKSDVDDFLHGSEEDMRRQAERLKERSVQIKSPENELQGRGGHGNSKVSAQKWADELLGKS